MKIYHWVILGLLYSSSTFAQQEVSVAEAKRMRDDRHVTLTGIISGRADDDHYWLKDSTGRVRIDRDEDDDDDRYFLGKKVQISGEIDRDDRQVEIDVNRIVILN